MLGRTLLCIGCGEKRHSTTQHLTCRAGGHAPARRTHPSPHPSMHIHMRHAHTPGRTLHAHTNVQPRFNCPLISSAQENAFNYDKGVLAEILEPIMGKGLIPADLETWKPRRRAVVPAFHKQFYEAMAVMFARCSQRTVDKLDAAIGAGKASGGLVRDSGGKAPCGWRIRQAAGR